MFDTNFNHFKSVFAHNFFVEPADRNYFLARFAKIYGMHEEFWWQSAQAVEKYLKAGLILNEVSVARGFGHNLVELWKKHAQVFGPCAVGTLAKPETLNAKFWKETPLETFIARINRWGDPDSRYGLFSYSNWEDDIFKLDQLCFELRRRTIGLNWVIGEDWEDEDLRAEYGKTYKDLVVNFPKLQIRKIKAPDERFSKVGTDLSDVWYSWNLAFTRNAEDIEKPAPVSVAPSMGGFGNAYIALLHEKLLATPTDIYLRKQANWLLDNVKLGSIGKSLKEILNGDTK